MIFGARPTALPTPDEALAGRSARPFTVSPTHAVLGTPLEGEVPDGHAEIVLGTGCYWGTEEFFWQVPGVWTTSVGFAGGITPHPTYDEVCTGMTGHAEVVRVVYDPAQLSLRDLLKVFWETHDPTQGMRQGNDIGSQYRSVIFTTTDEQREVAEQTRAEYAAVLAEHGYGDVTTTIEPLATYYLAEDAHQQYLHKNPFGYRCHASAGLPFPA